MVNRIQSIVGYLLIAGFYLLPQAALSEDGSLWIDGKDSAPPIELNLPSFAPVVDKLGKAVVNVSIQGKIPAVPLNLSQQGKGFKFGQPDDQGGGPSSPFDFFLPFPQAPQQERTFRSLGSGFVIHPEGYIVTNNHVVERATKIIVTFRDNKTEYEAKVVGADPKTDIALLKIDTQEKLTSVVLGDSDELKAGDWVIAIGNPFRLGHTATVGIVSGKSRRVPGGGPYDDFIQTDASINPGNSGGPLFNARGEVIGVNTAIFSPGRFGSSGFNIGIGFATPINLVKNIIGQLHSNGKVTRGWLGVLIQKVTNDVADALKLGESEGALVADVMPNSPAAKAGIERGDVITSFDGHKIVENEDLPLIVANTPIGKEAKVIVMRHGKSKQFDIKIEELKEEQESQPITEAEEDKLGLSVQDITPDIAKALGIEEGQGIVVSNVVIDSAAQNAGLEVKDVILEVNSQPVNSSKEFRKLTKDLQKNKPLLLLVKRDNNTIFLTLKLE